MFLQHGGNHTKTLFQAELPATVVSAYVYVDVRLSAVGGPGSSK
jgi:hypothetical protein